MTQFGCIGQPSQKKESNEVECSSTYSMQEQNYGGSENDFKDQTGRSFQNYLDTCDDDHENQNAHSPESSPFSSDNDSEEQNIDGVVNGELTTCSNDNESEYSGKCLDLNDPKVINFFAQSKPTEDPLWVNMFVYLRNKRNLLKQLRNPLYVL